jgi:tRNA(Ile)-lysidine synthase
MGRRELKFERPTGQTGPTTPPGLCLDRVRKSPECRRVAFDLRRLARPWGSPVPRRVHEIGRVLLAVSGGADSSALALLIASVPTLRDRLVIAHVIHDLRPAREANADARRVRELASMLGVPIVCGRVRASALARSTGGNIEGVARTLRYAALVRLARRHSCIAVATAHHADDQLETMLMAMMRGAGPRGLAGVAERRPLAGSGKTPMVLIRPMLSLRRADSERICTLAGWRWSVDATNDDQRRLRAAVRAQVVPVLERLRPGVAHRAVDAARVQASAARTISMLAREISPRGDSWPRASLGRIPAVVLGEVFRREARLRGIGTDAITSRALADLRRVIRDDSTDPRTLRIGPLAVTVSAKMVTLAASEPRVSRTSRSSRPSRAR